mgnify:CR=1 FL=1
MATRAVDFFDVKADVEALLGDVGVRFEEDRHAALHPGRSARLLLDDGRIVLDVVNVDNMRVNCTVVVGGEADLLTPPSSSQEIHALVPNSELIMLPDTGHMLPLERYVELNEIISTVAERVRAQSV